MKDSLEYIFKVFDVYQLANRGMCENEVEFNVRNRKYARYFNSLEI